MRFLGKLKKLLQRSTGYHIEYLGKRSVLISRRQDLWFSYDSLIQSIIETEGVNLVLDVGANEGQFGQKVRGFYSGMMISFEPVSSIYAKLQKVALSDPAWKVLQLALGSREGTQEINVSPQSVFSSFLKQNSYCSKIFGSESVADRFELVLVKRLDKLLKEIIPDIDKKKIFLKMDTQGYDMEVFKGLGNIMECVVAIQSEVSLVPIYEGMSHWTDCITIYEQNGFGVAGMFPVNRESNRVIEYDCVLKKLDSHYP